MNKDIIKYTVKIRTDKDSGSGIIVRTENNSEIAFILTARHLFIADDECINSGEWNKLEIENIDISTDTNLNKNKIIPLHKNVYIYDNTNADLAIILINVDGYVNSIPPLQLYVDKIPDNQSLLISGFCRNKFESNIFFTSLLHDVGYPNDVSFQLTHIEGSIVSSGGDNLILAGRDSIIGISGGGVFIKNNNNIYLIGIQNSFDGHNLFTCTNLNTKIYEKIDEIISNINLELNLPFEKKLKNILINENILINNEKFDLSTLDFESFKNRLEKNSLNYDTNKSRNVNLFEEEKITIEEKRKFLEETKINIENDLKEIANFYAEWGLFFSIEKKYRKATINFKEAVKINDAYRNILLQEKASRYNSNKQEQEKAKAILIKAEEESLSNIKSKKDKIISYKNFADLHQELGIDDENKEFYLRKALTLLMSNSKDGQATDNDENSLLIEIFNGIKEIIEEKYNRKELSLEQKFIQFGNLYTEIENYKDALTYYITAKHILSQKGHMPFDLYNEFLELIEKLKEMRNYNLTSNDIKEIEVDAQKNALNLIKEQNENDNISSYNEILKIKNLIYEIHETNNHIIKNNFENQKKYFDNFQILLIAELNKTSISNKKEFIYIGLAIVIGVLLGLNLYIKN